MCLTLITIKLNINNKVDNATINLPSPSMKSSTVYPWMAYSVIQLNGKRIQQLISLLQFENQFIKFSVQFNFDLSIEENTKIHNK